MLLLTPLVTALCIAGVIYKGAEITQVNVNDGGIWVTNKSRQLVGHLDYEARILDGALRTEATNFDIGQAGEIVTLSDLNSATVSPVDVTSVSLGSPTALPAGATAQQGGKILAALNPTDGTLWATSAATPNPQNFIDGAALASSMGASAFTTTQKGTIYALSTTGTLTTVAKHNRVQQASTSTINGIPTDAQLTMTAVGERPIALDSNSNTLILPGGTLVNLSAAGIEAGGVLQQPGPDSDAVLLATPSTLVSIPLRGGAPTITPAIEGGASGIPSAPVRHESCSYGAWGGSGAYLRTCDDPSANRQMVVDSLVSAREIVFRTNRKAIVLNDVAQGSVWLPDANMVLMDNWDEVENQLQESEDEQDSPELTNEIADPERREENTPPEANDDEFGIRPGRSTALPVLDNDSDLDGDVLTAAPTSQPAWGSVAATRGGRALQIENVPADQSGSTTFSYAASDGQASDSARVTLTIHPYTQNDAPVQLRASSVKIGANAQIQYSVLGDWRDPDGDPIYLKDIQVPDGLSATFSEDGTLQIREMGGSAGPKTIVLTVADDQGAETRGELIVNVQEPGNLPPVANGDFFQAHPGEILTLDPLTNDTDPNGDPLRLVAVSGAPSGATIAADLDRGTIDFRAATPGSYSFSYTISDGVATTLGIIRVEVIDTVALPPVAENDTAVLPLGGSVLVNALANDSDPAGGLLSIASIDTSGAPELEVSIIDRHLLRVVAPHGLERTANFTYVASNGSGQSTATVTVIPGSVDRSNQPPIVSPDRGKVRVGDVGSVSVLSNDRSPAGLALTVESTLTYDAATAVGTPYVSGNQVGIEAGNTPGIMDVTYTVIDSAGNRAASTVTFEVLASSDTNESPRPRDVTAWGVAGQSVRIPITLNGIDPDGDSVTLTGLDSSPTQGSATVGATWIDYTPNRGARGTDTFTYTVEDRLGARASARVRVSISPEATSNQNPIAVPDTILARPDRIVSINVTSNDVDPDGDEITLARDGVETPSTELDPQVVSNSTVQLRTPSTEGSYLLTYTIDDGKGGTARGVVTVYVEADAPLKAPIARDDYVAYADLPTDGSAVRVSVTTNDEDPDGAVSELTVSASEAAVTVDGQDLLIPVQEQRRLVVYTITDRDGLTNSAVVSVPGRSGTAPFLNAANLPIEMDAGTQLTINLSDYVVVRSGRSVSLVSGSSPVAQTGLDSVSADSATQLTLSATENFSGNSAFLIQVTDGEDEAGLSSTLSLPVRIRSTQKQPPTFTPTGVRVEAGGDAATSNLALGVSAAEGEDPSSYSYSLDSVPQGIQASLSGTVLTVSASEGATQGAVGSIQVSVTDGNGNTVSGAVPVEVVASTKPTIALPAYRVRARVGETVTVDVASGASNPFPDSPITLQGATTALGSATVNVSGTTVSITPNAAGDISVSFTVNDRLGDPARAVPGTIEVSVVDRPAIPTGVRAEARTSTSALVSFQAPASNGATIEGYTVYNAATGEAVATCASTVCAVEGLTTGLDYSFYVVARNAHGTSDPSPTSNTVRPIGRPSTITAPSLVAGDSAIDVSWNPPASTGGSPITYYELRVNGVVQGTRYTDNATRISALNGADTSVQVRAVNGAGEVGEWSSPSVARPRPSHTAPDRPVISGANSTRPRDGAISQLLVSWSLGAHGGTGWGPTTINVDGTAYPVAGGTTSATLTVNGTPSTVTVTVSNVEGDTATSPAAVVNATITRNDITGPPPQMEAPTITPVSGRAGVANIANIRRSLGGGWEADEVEVRWGGVFDATCSYTNVVPLDGTNPGGFNLTGYQDGEEVTLYFCQVGRRGSTVMTSYPVRAVGRAGSADRPPIIPVPSFEVQAFSDSPGAISVVWSPPEGIEVSQVRLSVQGPSTAAGRTYDGPVTSRASYNNVWTNLSPGTYTVSLEVVSTQDQHRTMSTTVQVSGGQVSTSDFTATFEFVTLCPDGGSTCGAFRLNYSGSRTDRRYGCTVRNDFSGRDIEYVFDRANNFENSGILTRYGSAAAFHNAYRNSSPITSCRVL